MLKQIKSKQAYILNENIGVSYNTPIAANVDGTTFITENYYSNTTAHHKTDIIRAFNNYNVIEVNQETIKDFYYFLTYGEYSSAQNLAAEIKKEEILKNEIITTIETGREQAIFFKNKNIYSFIKKGYRNKTPYKNGNFKEVQHFQTNFKYVSNIRFKETTRGIKSKIRTSNSKPGKAKSGSIFYKYKYRSVIYSY